MLVVALLIQNALCVVALFMLCVLTGSRVYTVKVLFSGMFVANPFCSSDPRAMLHMLHMRHVSIYVVVCTWYFVQPPTVDLARVNHSEEAK